MTITRREPPVPTMLPAARLYLDDVEEIAAIIAEAGNEHPVQPGKHGPEIRFQVKDRLCDQIDDLPKVGERTNDFEIHFDNDQRGYFVRLGVSSLGCQWTSIGLTKEESWSAFRKLEVVFNGRKIHRPDGLLGIAFWVVIVVVFAVLANQLGRMGVRLHISDAVTLLPVFGFIIIAFAIAKRFYAGSAVFFHRSRDQAARRKENFWRLVPSIVTGVIGLIVGVILTYLKHKYWP